MKSSAFFRIILFSKLYRLAVPGSSKDFSAPLFGFSGEQVKEAHKNVSEKLEEAKRLNINTS